MNKYSCIVAFGDSLVAGAELDGNFSEYMYLAGQNKMTIQEMDTKTKQLTFPQLVANQLKVPCHNMAMSGGSNDRSLRMLINNIHTFDNPLILFCYTTHVRREFYYPLKTNRLIKDDTDFVQVGSIASFWHGRVDGKDIRSNNHLNDLYLKHFMHGYDNSAEIAICVESLCKYFSYNVIHLPLMKFKTLTDLGRRLPNMDLYDFDGKKSFELWYTLNGYPQHEWGHPKQPAHIDLAEKLTKYIQKKYDKVSI